MCFVYLMGAKVAFGYKKLGSVVKRIMVLAKSITQ